MLILVAWLDQSYIRVSLGMVQELLSVER